MDASPTVSEKLMALPPLSEALAEDKPLLTLRCALAKRSTSISCEPVVAAALVVTPKAAVLLLEAVTALKLFWSLSAVMAVLTPLKTNDKAE